MNWKQYKRGLLIAAATGLLTALVAWNGDMAWKSLLVLVVGTIAKDCLLYMAQHPQDQIKDTAFFTNPNTKQNEKDNPTGTPDAGFVR